MGKYIDVMVSSISDNGGRSCVNASAVIVPKYAKEIADALGKRLGPLKPLPVDDPNAVLSGFANPKMGEWIDQTLEADFAEKGNGCHTLQRWFPSCKSRRRHLLASYNCTLRIDGSCAVQSRIFVSLYRSVVEVPQADMLRSIGPTLVVTAITGDERFKNQLLAASNVERLNIGAISTMKISWDQPHEGNMFEFLYKRRSIGMAA